MGYQFEEEAGRIVVKDKEGTEAGELTFTREGDDVIIIDHTGVEPAHRGQGLAEQLVNKAVDKAKKENLRVMPVCPFAKKKFEENEEYKAVL
ncbi:GNAT family N-acetyltransferase [Oceanobacillus sp. FSL H7-0719]|uniref:GNAT family N-acetyltransferase n=1 Tax=Oceanobacillus sp. FSL H7-0719 TaxID=2954507 RepID=UPI0032474FA2